VIVVDTSVVVDLFRAKKTRGAERLRALERDGTPYAIPALCCQELLQGAKDEKEWRLLLAYLEVQEHLGAASAWSTHVGAARIFFDCRRKGLTVRSMVDCLIAQQVLEIGGTLLHADRDFENIARVRPLRTLLG
jgi:predicted nucleic acid-binding protein